MQRIDKSKVFLVCSLFVAGLVAASVGAGVVFEVETTVVAVDAAAGHATLVPAEGKRREATLSFKNPDGVLSSLQTGYRLTLRIDCVAYADQPKKKLDVEVRGDRQRKWHRGTLGGDGWMPWDYLKRQAKEHCQ